MTVLDVEEVVSVRALQVVDRCDRCNSQAFMLATKAGSELLFCAHHGKANFDTLVTQGFIIDDQSHLLEQSEKDWTVPELTTQD